MRRVGAFVGCGVILLACVGSDPELPTFGSPESDGGSSGNTPSQQQDAGDGSVDVGPCDGVVCNGACTDVKKSAAHCGACGHDCGGGTCENGTCRPVVVASEVASPVGVAVSGNGVFWLRNGAVERCPVTGCTEKPALITDEPIIGDLQPGGTTIVTDGNYVAWISSGSTGVFACSVAGCSNGQSPRVAQGPNDTPTQLALFGSKLFVAQATGAQHMGNISDLDLAVIGGSGSDVPTGIAADSATVYVAGTFQSASGVDKCTLPSCTGNKPRLFTDASRIAVAGSNLVATSSVGIVKCAIPAGCGGAPTKLAPEDKDAVAIAADANTVVWVVPGSASNADGKVRSCAMPDCAGGPRTIADGQARPVSVAIANGFVYWANKGLGSTPGSIWRAAL